MIKQPFNTEYAQAWSPFDSAEVGIGSFRPIGFDLPAFAELGGSAVDFSGLFSGGEARHASTYRPPTPVQVEGADWQFVSSSETSPYAAPQLVVAQSPRMQAPIYFDAANAPTSFIGSNAAQPATSGLTINLIFDPSTNSAPASFKTVANAVADYLESQFKDPITINIHIGWGELNGETLPSGALAASSTNVIHFTYSQIRSALIGDSSSGDDQLALSNLPTSDPTGGGYYILSTAEAKALGLYASNGADGFVGVDKTAPLDYNNANGVSGYDLFGVLVHEITEVMGRILGVGETFGGTDRYFLPLDLFHYSGYGTRTFSGSTPGWFSINDGVGVDGVVSGQNRFNTDPQGDFGDWGGNPAPDSCDAFATPNVVLPVSDTDLITLDVIGWDRTSPTPADFTATAQFFEASDSDTGFRYVITNDGVYSKSSKVGLYLSSDNTITRSDLLIDTVALGILRTGASKLLELMPGTFPHNLAPGSYYLGAIANYDSAVWETNTANNASSGLRVILGNDGANTLSGTPDDPILGFGGDDVITISGNGGNLNGSIDGGDGYDTVILSNTQLYPTFHPGTLINVERLDLGAWNIIGSYQIEPNDATVAAGKTLVIDGSKFTSLSIWFSGTRELDGAFDFIGGSASNHLIGGRGDDTLRGGTGSDFLDGYIGSDSMIGGAGRDHYTVDNTNDIIVEGVDGGAIDDVYSTATYVLPDNVEYLVLGGNSSIDGTGNALPNKITGNAKANHLNGSGDNDTLDGGAGADTMAGGAGDDYYWVENAADLVVESPNEGIDTVVALVNYTLTANVENLQLGGNAVAGTGNSEANVIFGNENNNSLRGMNGDDTLNGEWENDTLNGGNGTDTVSYAYFPATSYNQGVHVSLLITGAQTISSNLGSVNTLISIENIIGSNYADDLTGNNDANLLSGGDLADTLNGAGGDDTLDGGTGADSMLGGAGNDTYLVDNASDSITELSGDGVDDVRSAVTYTLTANVENLTLVGPGNLNGTGSADANLITGNSGANTLTGLAGNDTLDGGDGVDTMYGGDGNDTYVVNTGGDVTTEDSAGGGIDTVRTSVNRTLGAYIENLTQIGTNAINGTGNSLDNVLTGNSADNKLNGSTGDDTLIGNDGNDSLDGGAGDDSMAGGKGNDSYIVNSTGDITTETVGGAAGGTDTVQSSVNYSLGSYIENLTQTGLSAINGTGNSLANLIIGNDANNKLNGGNGNDTLLGNGGDDSLTGGGGVDSMNGGDGDDIYVVDNGGDITTEDSASGGIDTVQSSVNRTLGAFLENLTQTGSNAINGTGNSLANVMTGNAADNKLNGASGDDTLIGNNGNDSLNGGAGDDSMEGGDGDDIYVVDSTGDITVETSAAGGTDTVQSSVTRTLDTNIENLTLTGANAIDGAGNTLANILIGNAGDNELDGGDGDDTLVGNGGADTLDGGAGDDSMAGGDGDDVYVVDSASDITTEDSVTGGTDTVQSSVTRTLDTNIENLTLTGGGTIDGTGNSLANILTGNDADNSLSGADDNDTLFGNGGNDTLDGGAGDDSMVGGDGDDVYVVDSAGDITTESSALGGTDTVQSSVTHTLDNNIENLTLTGSDLIDGTGNSLANTISGNDSANRLLGAEDDDSLSGNGGNDTLVGGLGSDTLTGGAGGDAFVFDIAPDGVDIDQIVDFSSAESDTIQLDNAVMDLGAEGALVSDLFYIGAAAHDADDRIIYDDTTGALYYDADGDGAGSALQIAWLSPSLLLAAEDFLVT